MTKSFQSRLVCYVFKMKGGFRIGNAGGALGCVLSGVPVDTLPSVVAVQPASVPSVPRELLH